MFKRGMIALLLLPGLYDIALNLLNSSTTGMPRACRSVQPVRNDFYSRFLSIQATDLIAPSLIWLTTLIVGSDQNNPVTFIIKGNWGFFKLQR